jgi:hypothetical protein
MSNPLIIQYYVSREQEEYMEDGNQHDYLHPHGYRNHARRDELHGCVAHSSTFNRSLII